MGEPFTVETKLTIEEYKKYAWFWYLRIGKSRWLGIILFSAVFALDLYIVIYEAVNHGFGWQFLVPKLIVLFYVPMILMANRIRISRRYKKRWRYPVKYEFAADGFRVEFFGAPAPNREEYKYWMLRRVGETRDAFYLDCGEYYIVPGSSMGGDMQERFAALLKQGLGKKYIKCF